MSRAFWQPVSHRDQRERERAEEGASTPPMSSHTIVLCVCVFVSSMRMCFCGAQQKRRRRRRQCETFFGSLGKSNGRADGGRYNTKKRGCVCECSVWAVQKKGGERVIWTYRAVRGACVRVSSRFTVFFIIRGEEEG